MADSTKVRAIGRAAGRITRKTGQIADLSAARTSKTITRPCASPNVDRNGSQTTEWKAEREAPIARKELAEDQILDRRAEQLSVRSTAQIKEAIKNPNAGPSARNFSLIDRIVVSGKDVGNKRWMNKSLPA